MPDDAGQYQYGLGLMSDSGLALYENMMVLYVINAIHFAITFINIEHIQILHGGLCLIELKPIYSVMPSVLPMTPWA